VLPHRKRGARLKSLDSVVIFGHSAEMARSLHGGDRAGAHCVGDRPCNLESKETSMSDDHSPGDGRNPYSDRGGKQAKHAETHDVRREQLTNPTGPAPEDPSFAEQLAPVDAGTMGGHEEESLVAADEKQIRNQLPELSGEELSRLTVLETGARLDQGGVYLDLNQRENGPFKALGGHDAKPSERLVAKRDIDYELWNQLTGDHQEIEIEQPVEA